jgi:hypothetical protein
MGKACSIGRKEGNIWLVIDFKRLRFRDVTRIGTNEDFAQERDIIIIL